MKGSDLIVEVQGVTFWAGDVRILQVSEGDDQKRKGFKIYFIQLVLADIPGTVTFRYDSKESRNAEHGKIKDLMVKYHEMCL